jgi:cytochrome d ubiquinol oxidase subunit I
MDFLMDDVFLSRVQFAFATGFHICFSSFSVGLAVFLAVMEGLWLKTRDDDYLRHARLWGKLFLLVFAVGVVTGLPLAFQFGTNWERFSAATGGFFGNLLHFEATMAFLLEASFLGVMLFGWNRVSPRAHFFATLMVAFGASLSAFWIMVANAWMQTPAGGHMENGRFVVDSYVQAIFNPDWFGAFSHMWVACLETALFVVGGVSAWKILVGKHPAFFRKSFRVALWAALFAAPLQFLLGDHSGLLIAKHQPAKLAATEAHWVTNPPGQPASWNMAAWPNREKGKNDFEVRIPYGLSLIITHSFTGQVKGLLEFPPDERPPILIPFYAFRIMMGLGMAMIGLALVTAFLDWKKKLTAETITGQKQLLFLWTLMIPTGFLAVLAGWMTREVGRQPWVVYGLIRTEDAASVLPAPAVGLSLLFFVVVYAVLLVVFSRFALRIMAGDPPALPARWRNEGGK